MGGLCYQTSIWSDSLLSRYAKADTDLKDIIAVGSGKQKTYGRFAEDIHARMYLRHEPSQLPKAPEWAKRIHQAASELPEWAQLRRRCQALPMASGIATEEILKATLPLVPENKPDKPQGRPQGGNGGTQDKEQGQEQGQEESDRQQRQNIRDGIQSAQQAIDQAEESVEALAEALGVNAGKDPATPPSEKDHEAMVALYAALKDNPDLRAICDLAGRLKRMARAKRKGEIKAYGGEIVGVAPGKPDILPSEIVGLRGSRLARLQTIARITQRQALGYTKKPLTAPLAKGPFILLLDISPSMRGERIKHARALALAFMARATQEKRDFAIIPFNAQALPASHFRKGAANMQALIDVLSLGLVGGTSFDRAVQAGIDTALADPKVYSAADLVMITDGEDNLHPRVNRLLTHMMEKTGSCFYVIGMGRAAVRHLEDMRDVATEMWLFDDAELGRSGEVLSPLICP